MNRDEILAMPAGRCMDAMIAEKVMQHPVKRDAVMWREGIVSNEPYSEGFTTLAHYSTDISAAWEVHKKICNSETYASPDAMCYYGYLQQSLSARLGGGSPVYPYVLAFIEPIDICRAALLTTL